MLKKIFGLLILSLAAKGISAATLTVDLNGGADYTAIQPAIDAAADGDTVLVKPGEYVITESLALLGYLFLGEAEPPFLDAADIDDSGTLDITDAIYGLEFLFLGGKALPEPTGCGADPTADELTCASYGRCP